MRARSSAVEHYGDIVGVAGSNPAAPTIFKESMLYLYLIESVYNYNYL